MSNPDVEIRLARKEEAPILSGIAQAAKQHWGYPQEWMELWREDLTLTPEILDQHTVFCACDGDILGFYALGFYSLSDTGVHAAAELEHMWIDPRHMGRGLGRRLLAHATEQARQRGAAALRIVADPNAEGFYRKAGAQPVGRVASVPAGRLLPVMRLPLA